MMARDSWLQIVERGLWIVGLALAAWVAAVLVEARYTRTLSPPVKVVMTLPGDARTPTPTSTSTSTSSAAVPRTLEAGSVIGRLESSSLKLSAPILEGSDDATLNRGAGHLEDTPLPGEPGNVGIAGHRDTVFRPLRHAKVGDTLTLTTGDRTLRYEIRRTLIVNPNDVYVLDPTATPTLTLVTCYPFEFVGHAPKRFIVQAQLITE